MMPTKKLDQLLTASLGMAAKAHFWHLTTPSYAQHIVFGELYGFFHDTADRFTETARGAWDYKPANRTSAVAYHQDALSDIKKYIDLLENCYCTDEPWWNAIIDEIAEHLKKVIYQLKYLK